MLIFFTSRHCYFFEKLKIVEKPLCKLNFSYSKVSHTLKLPSKFKYISQHNFRVYNNFESTLTELVSAKLQNITLLNLFDIKGM